MTVARARTGLARLEASGSAIALPDGRWCARHLLVRLHAASRGRRRRHVEPASLADFVRFVACWQHVAAGTQAEGRSGLLSVIEQLQGLEVAAGEWERTVLPARVAGYDPRWLDELCLAGEVAWGTAVPETRRTPADEPVAPEALALNGNIPRGGRRGSATPSSGHPAGPRHPTRPHVDAGRRPDRPGGRSNRPPVPRPTSSAALRSEGARFRSELASAAGRLETEVDEGLWDLVARGIVTADAFSAVRSLLSARRRRSATRPGTGRRSRARTPAGPGRDRGRGGPLVPAAPTRRDRNGAARSGRRRRNWPRRWPGNCWPAGAWWPGSCGRGSRTGSPGGTWCGPSGGWRPAARSWAGGSWPASPASSMPRPRRHPCWPTYAATLVAGPVVEVAGADPLNLTGAMLGGARIPSIRDRTVHYRGGVPVASEEVVPTG